MLKKSFFNFPTSFLKHRVILTKMNKNVYKLENNQTKTYNFSNMFAIIIR